MSWPEYLEAFRNRRIGVVLLLGFASGLPLALTGGTLQAWMTVEGIELNTSAVSRWSDFPIPGNSSGRR